MVAGMRWHGAIVSKAVRAQVFRGIKATTIALHAASRKAASVPNTGEAIALTRKPGASERKRNKTQRTTYPNSSKPGEPPRRRTGFGQKNIVSGWDRKTTSGRVGHGRNARYMMFHEVGIRYKRAGLQRRPTVVPTFVKNLQRLRMIFKRYSR